MDEEKLKKLQAKIAYFRKIGQNQRADQIENKITKKKAKEEYKEEKGPSKVGKIIKKVKSSISKEE